jgi:hypothetical protein
MFTWKEKKFQNLSNIVVHLLKARTVAAEK